MVEAALTGLKRSITIMALVALGLLAQNGYALSRGRPKVTGLAEVNGTRLYYEMMGKGRPIVLIGIGAGVDSRLWDDQFRAFAKRFRVIRYDIRGFGKSAAPTSPYSHVEDLYGLLKFLKIKKAYIAGLSAGGGIAIDFTLEHPQMVGGLIVVGSVVSGFQFSDMFRQRDDANIKPALSGDYEAMAKNMLADPYTIPSLENPSARERYRKLLLDEKNTRRFTVEYPAPRRLNPPAIGRLSEIHAPTLIITGSLDIADVLKIAHILEAGIAGSERINIPGAGHMVNMEKPEAFNQAVLGFLRKL
jgi:pimeloyl-ACP methyl ester carboxylesterase